jgi:hypothetical protein
MLRIVVRETGIDKTVKSMRKNLPVLSARKRDKDGLTDRIAASAKPTRPSAGQAPLLSLPLL